ncbi:MAG: vWA domain-containing protein [Candidatus Promineifilaceae bacterium]
MDDRITEFIRGLRAANVRVSMAEGIDAFRAIEQLGIRDRTNFRDSLRTTLIKESNDFEVFDRLFPLYFGSGEAHMEDATTELNNEELDMLQDVLQGFNDRTQQLLEWLTSGDGPSKEDLEAMAEQMSQQWRDSPRKAYYVTQSMMRELGMKGLEGNLQKLMQALQEKGLSQEKIDALMGITRGNARNLREQVAHAAGLGVAREKAERTGNGKGDGQSSGLNTNSSNPDSESDIMDRPFEALSYTDTEELRVEVRRMVQQLRSRAALRRKRGKKGKFDPKATIRKNMQYGGVPIELKFKQNKQKPSLVFIVDVSGSMERIIEFLLRFVHQLNDQVSRIRIFTFYGDLRELNPKIIELVGNNHVEDAFYVIRKEHPYRPYATNLGNSLETFYKQHLSSIDGQTTTVFLGDGRNNYTANRADLVQDLQRRSKRLLWLNPERDHQWGTGDSDMLHYIPHCDNVFVVSNLRQLSHAIDNLFVG